MFQWLIVHTITTAALAVVVLAASRWFRLSPAARHLLWLVVLIKFLTPPVVSWPWPLPTFSPAPPPVAAPPHVGVRTVIIDMPPDFGSEPEVIDAPPLAPVAAPPVEMAPAAPPFSWNWLPTALAWAWVAGGVLVALLQATRILRWRRRLRRGASAPDGLQALVLDLAASRGVRPPRLTVLPGVASPMVWCFGVPRLLWPAGLEDRLSAPGCRAVLLHELTHLRRRDHWVGWLMLIGGCVWWWHPLYWWLRRRLGQEAELACDAWVVGNAPGARRAYAEALLEVSQRMAAAVVVPALGATGGRRDLERRLVMIMRGPASRRLSWVGLAGAIALGLLVLPAWTLGEAPKSKSQPPAVASTTPTPVVNEPSSGGGASASIADSERKIKEKVKELVEERIEQLFKEMQQLREQAPGAEMPSVTAQGSDWTVLLEPKMSLLGGKPGGILFTTKMPSPPAPGGGESGAEVITLTHATYKLKPATAKALSAFLKDNVKTAILETKSDGESLVVTTTPETQEVVGQFIHLLHGLIVPAIKTESGYEVFTLTRVSYKLKPVAAESLSTLLRENLKPEFLQIRNEGETLVVTTIPDAQHAIGQLIRFLQTPTTVPTLKSGTAPTGDKPEGAVIPPGTNPAAPAPPTNESRAKTAHPEISSTLGDYPGNK